MGLSLSSQPTLSHGFATIILSYILKHRGCIREIVAISLYNNILYVTLRASERSLKKIVMCSATNYPIGWPLFKTY